MSDKELLQIYVGIAPFLAKVCGPSCEVAVHDLSDPSSSLVAIHNSVSGRQVGSPVTDLAQKIIDRNDYTHSDYIANYIGRNKNGEFLSSTYYIKNEGRLIGLLCINKDMSVVRQTHTNLQYLLEQFNLTAPEESDVSEWLENPVANIMHTRIADIIAQSGIPPARMSVSEKIATVHRLNEDGIMMMKGAVPEIAAQLHVSVPTVYRYLNKSAG